MNCIEGSNGLISQLISLCSLNAEINASQSLGARNAAPPRCTGHLGNVGISLDARAPMTAVIQNRLAPAAALGDSALDTTALILTSQSRAAGM